MQVIEKFILGKNKDQSKCEDIIFINEYFVAIIDGATSKSDYEFNGNSTGRQAALLVEEALSTLPKEANKKESAEYITNHIYNFYLKNDYLKIIEKGANNKCTASVIIYSNFHKEIWQFGDCLCLIDDTLYESNKLIDFLTCNTRAFFITSLIDEGYTVDELLENDLSRHMIIDMLKTQQKFQNISLKETQFAYVCFDGFPIHIDDVPTIKIENNVKQIVLSSDGYPKLFKTLKESEHYLEFIKKEDPLCYKKFLSTKGFCKHLNSYDDRSYISFNI